MKTKTSLPRLAEFLISDLNRLLTIYISIFTLIIGITFGFIHIKSLVLTDHDFIQSIQSHVASLVESQDRPELLRLLSSIKQNKKSDLVLTQSNFIIASTRNYAELDRPFHSIHGIEIEPDVTLSSKGLVTKLPIFRKNGSIDENAALYIITPIASFIVTLSIFMFSIVFLTFGFSHYITSQLTNRVKSAIYPLAQLDHAIRDLISFKNTDTIAPQHIQELENIRLSIVETHKQLIKTQDALVTEKAKSLLTEAYKRLIHDLHNPIRCLDHLVQATNANIYGNETASEALTKIPVIAEEILMQIEAAKSNLDFESPTLKESDLKPCIEGAAMVAKNAFTKEVILDVFLPEEKLISLYDQRLLKRAIGNLIGNAIEACTQNVRVFAKKDLDNISITIEDDGPGIPDEAIGLYLQGRKKSTKSDRQALGLSAANHIIRSHGGKIVYKTSQLGGASFEVRL